MSHRLFVLIFILNTILITVSSADTPESRMYAIEGRVFPAPHQDKLNWQVHIRISLNGGEYIGFLRDNGTFVIRNVPKGSYIVEIIHPDYKYGPVRVEINSKGKYRARIVDLIQTSEVIVLSYPLKLKVASKLNYFQEREQWRLTDFLFDHMVVMMLLPLLIIMILPKLMPLETQEDLKKMSKMANISDIPDVSEMFTNLFSGATAKLSKPKTKKYNKCTMQSTSTL
ncbi:endoplasmic reticulum membrane protein complex subunit 7-like [Plodia interpunctella]|uniref:endoplasmic reticulum membrane protein complex subunit 7-like n=1 Tax=Plodia interpunctella TaxID=58824 RepID=UPI002368D5E0|nr:ER membrane protein complex subunit 7-like [Plodia interpunctella]